MKKIFIILLTAALSCGIASAQKPGIVLSDKAGWHKIGGTSVNFQRDTDVIYVLAADRFAALKFKVKYSSINLMGMKVCYEDGTMEDVTGSFPYHIQAPGDSKSIDLKGTERDLKKVVFTYATVPETEKKTGKVKNEKRNSNAGKDNDNSSDHEKKAYVELWGLKTNADKTNKDRDTTSSSNNKNSRDYK